MASTNNENFARTRTGAGVEGRDGAEAEGASDETGGDGAAATGGGDDGNDGGGRLRAPKKARRGTKAGRASRKTGDQRAATKRAGD